MQLLGNEPCVDPLAYAESEYCETATIVDALDMHGHGQNHLVTTTIIYGESLFAEDLKLQAVSTILQVVIPQKAMHSDTVELCIIN